jgi:sporulation protein YlmC with PRC-barrel domain
MTNTRQALLASAVSALLALSVSPVLADSTNATTTNTTNTNATNADVDTNMGVTAVDAGKLIDKDVYDANGDKVGAIDSVIVDTNGKVSSVVLDVGGWLSSKKLISVPWKDLKSSADGKITTTMTKDQAQAAADYKYKQDQARGKVQTANGDLYNSPNTAQNSTMSNGGAGAPTTNQQTTANGNTTQDASQSTASSGSIMGTPVKNSDGSLNASQVIGMTVVNKNNESIGKIGELVMGNDGKVSGVVVDVGGFLGIGTHPVLLDWKQISMVDQNGSTQAVVNESKDQLKQMPAYSSK